MPIWQRGQSSFTAEGISVRAREAPQWEQNFAPAKTIPKHDGHATTARREPQCVHEVASDGTGAPHEGQFMVSGVVGMWGGYIDKNIFTSGSETRNSERGKGNA